jgi:hypothetical protein
MKAPEAALLVVPFVAIGVLEARGLRQLDRAPEDRATYSAGGRTLFRLHTLPGRLVFLVLIGGALKWFVPHMFRGASERIANAAAALLDIDADRPTFDTEEN